MIRYIRRTIWRWLEPDADALITDRLLDFYDGLREREQIQPPLVVPTVSESSK